jgi:hypothetical protein
MANKLNKNKRKYLIRIVGEAAQDMAITRRAIIRARQLHLSGFMDRQNRAYMSIYC